jgi:Cu(I)/Ag(I) efflux system membrane fusion protein
MRFTRRFLAFGFLALLVFGSGSCTQAGKSAAPASSPGAQAAAAHQETWTCAMHPQIRQHEPGDCPICGMRLVRVDDDPVARPLSTAPEGHVSFDLSDDRQQMIGVKWGTVQKKKLFKSIRAPGRLAFDPELYTAESEYVEALQQLSRVHDSPISDVKHSAQELLNSARLRLKILGLSDAQIRGLGKGGSSDSLLLHKQGEDTWVYAEVYEMDLPYIHPGLSAEITAEFLGGKRLAGRVVSVDRVINAGTRTAKVRILIPKAQVLLRPESYVDVTIHSPLGEQLVVPWDAVMDTGEQAWVFVGNGKGGFEPRKVAIRFRSGDDVAIESGLSGGEEIVTSANFLIDSESRLRAARADAAKPKSEDPR